MSAARATHFHAVIPVFEDWEAAALLLARLDAACAATKREGRVLLVDDGSSTRPGDALQGPYRALSEVEILRLARNMGHQRAIAIGLTFLHQERDPAEAVVVLDADGEDRPEDVPALLAEFERLGGETVVFAERARRSEGIVFRAFYQLYRAIHFLLTGIAVRVGNFSVLPWSALATFVVVSEAWNHYAAAVFKARIPRATLPLARGERLAGRSTMNFVALALHGLSAISVFGEIVGGRLLLTACAGLATFVVLLAACCAAAWAGWLELPPWLGVWIFVSMLLCAQFVILAFVITFSILNARNSLSFLPVRDYKYFVAGATRLFPRTP